MTDALDVVAAVIFDDTNRVLACRRRPEKAAGGKWEFPGGKVEHGESAVEALRREILEELAIDIQVTVELTSDETRVGERTIRLTCFRAVLTGLAPASSSDHDRLEWVHLHDLPAYGWAEPDLPAVRLLTNGQH